MLRSAAEVHNPTDPSHNNLWTPVFWQSQSHLEDHKKTDSTENDFQIDESSLSKPQTIVGTIDHTAAKLDAAKDKGTRPSETTSVNVTNDREVIEIQSSGESSDSSSGMSPPPPPPPPQIEPPKIEPPPEIELSPQAKPEKTKTISPPPPPPPLPDYLPKMPPLPSPQSSQDPQLQNSYLSSRKHLQSSPKHLQSSPKPPQSSPKHVQPYPKHLQSPPKPPQSSPKPPHLSADLRLPKSFLPKSFTHSNLAPNSPYQPQQPQMSQHSHKSLPSQFSKPFQPSQSSKHPQSSKTSQLSHSVNTYQLSQSLVAGANVTKTTPRRSKRKRKAGVGGLDFSMVEDDGEPEGVLVSSRTRSGRVQKAVARDEIIRLQKLEKFNSKSERRNRRAWVKIISDPETTFLNYYWNLATDFTQNDEPVSEFEIPPMSYEDADNLRKSGQLWKHSEKVIYKKKTKRN